MAKSEKKSETAHDETPAGTPEIKDEDPRLLPFKNDMVFKTLFEDRKYIAAIRAFLISAIDIPEAEYENLEIVAPHLKRNSPNYKQEILDVRLQLKNKKTISVEVQIHKMPHIAERMAFSTGRNLARQIGPGQSYARIAQVVTVMIADYDIIPDDKSYHHVFKLYDKDNDVLLTDVMEIHTLELRKLPDTAGADAREGELLDWLRLIRSENEEEIDMLAARTKEMMRMSAHLKKLRLDERARMIAEARELYQMDEATRREVAVAEAKAEGKIEMAKNLLLQGVVPAVIAQASGLPVEEIERLRS